MSEWTPSTHHVAPQPAGRQCANWYQRCQPSAEEILYALAHTKGERDTLRAALEELIASLGNAEIQQFPNRKTSDRYERSFTAAKSLLKAIAL